MNAKKPAMFAKPIVFSAHPCTVACDGRCDKAWGINGRPHLSLSDDENDVVSLADDELGFAPGPGKTVGLSEGGDMKPSARPLHDGRLMNKWCSRECERSSLIDPGEPLVVPDYSARVYNQPWKHEATEQAGAAKEEP